jgi:hypothetical protein
MNKDKKPEAFGVFSPVGHVVISFPTADDLQATVAELTVLGLGPDEIVRYTPQQMIAQVDQDMAQASSIAALGQEINLVRAHRALAEKGYHFLVVHAPKTERAQQVSDIAARHNAERAQRYGTFIIEEMIEQREDEGQTFESPQRGLDAQTESGLEKERSHRS